MKYTAFVPDVKTQLVADPSDPVVENAVKNAVIEFCQDSWIWREYALPASVTSGDSRIDIELPAGAELVVVQSVTLDGIELSPEGPDRLNRLYPRWDTETGAPKRYTQVDPSHLILSPVPDANYQNQLVVGCVFMPKRSSTSFPDWIGNQWWEGIVAGAASRLLAMTGRPWADLQAAAIKRQAFLDTVTQAKEAAFRGLTRAPVRVAMQH